MAAYLTAHDLSFESQYYFDELLGCGGGYLKFDFALFEDSQLTFLIELDGIQHYKPVEFFGGKEKYDKRKIHDALKTRWALDHGIPLIRIDVSACRYESDFIAAYESVFRSNHILN